MPNQGSRMAAPARRRFLQGALGLAMGGKTVGTPLLARAEPALRTMSPVAALGERSQGSLISISTIALSPDGKAMLTSINLQSDATLWDLAKREPLKTLPCEDIVATDFLADGKRAIIVSGSNKADIWDLAAARIVSTVAIEGEKIETAAVAPDGRRLAISQEDQLSLWDLGNGTRVTVRKEPDLGLIKRLAFASDGKWLGCVHRDEVRAYDPASLQPIAKWPVESANGGLACSRDGRFILFGDGERVRIFDVAGKREVGRVDKLGPDRSFFLGMAALGKDLFAVGDTYGHFLIGSTTRPGFIARSADPPIRAARVAISRDQKSAYVGTQEGQVLVFDVSGIS
jgi:hypothetical protein